MKLDFEYIRGITNKLHEASREAGGHSKEFDEGHVVYSISFDPGAGSCNIHVQWPYFRNLVANEADHPATYTRHDMPEYTTPWLHWSCDVLGMQIVCCMNKWDIVQELKALIAEHPESDYEICEDDDIENLLNIWQNMTGWNLDWPHLEATKHG